MHSSPNTLSSFGAAARAWPIWLWFARLDIRARYRGSLLGPVWLALNLATLSIGMGIVYGAVFGMPLSEYIPYLTTGFMVWWFLSGSLNESCTAFTANERLIRNQRLPLGIYVLRVLARNWLLLGHNFLVFVGVAIFFGLKPTFESLLVVPGFLLLATLVFQLSIILAILCARFRDVPHVVANFLQLFMLVSPIAYKRSQLEKHAPLADWNPVYHMIDVVRAPLLGHAPAPLTWMVLLCANLVFGAAAFLLMRRWGSRVPCMV